MTSISTDSKRFNIIEAVYDHLLKATNIGSCPDEMAAVKAILFRLWQCGYLKLECPGDVISASLEAEKTYFKDFPELEKAIAGSTFGTGFIEGYRYAHRVLMEKFNDYQGYEENYNV